MYTVTKSGRKIVVSGPKGTFRYADKRRAMSVAQGLADGRMTVETANKLQAIDKANFG